MENKKNKRDNKKDETKRKKLAILTGGGDCPGLNTAIKSIVLGASRDFDVEGITLGWDGAIKMSLDPSEKTIEIFTLPLTPESVRRIDREGGTRLMSSRSNPYNYNKRDVSGQVVNFLNKRYFSIIAIGGEDTLGAAGKLAKQGLRVIGIPKTIDNDLCGTEYTLGFDSAVNTVKQLVTNLKSTAGSHGMVYFVEIMGRSSGHLTYWGGRAARVHFMTLPEVETDYLNLFKLILARKNSFTLRRGFTSDGLRYAIVLVSEGTKLKGVGEIRKGKKDDHGNIYLGGIADYLCNEYIKVTGDHNARSLTLGHLQRGGAPSNKDGIMAEALAEKALELVKQKKFGRMASIIGNYIRDTPLHVVIGRIKVLDAQKCFDAKHFHPRVSSEQIHHEIEVEKK